MLTQKDPTGRSLLANAAYSGDVTTFRAVLEAIQTNLGTDQVWLELFLIFFIQILHGILGRLTGRSNPCTTIYSHIISVMEHNTYHAYVSCFTARQLHY